MMTPAATRQGRGGWLVENGSRQLELLLRAVLYHSSLPVLITDDKRECLDASFGAGKLLGLSRDQLLGRALDDFVDPGFRPGMERLWGDLLAQGRLEGALPILSPAGSAREVSYAASGSILPMRHLLVIHDGPPGRKGGGKPSRVGGVPSWAKDIALLLLDADGGVAAWYAGAERIFGYACEEAIGRRLSFLLPSETVDQAGPLTELTKALARGRFGSQGWRRKKDGSLLWANVLTVAILDGGDRLQGFASIVRDFSERHQADQKSPNGAGSKERRRAQGTTVGVIAGEYDRVTSASDKFLDMVGYSHEELVAGRPYWPSLTPPEHALRDEEAHEEALIHGACTPFEKEFIRKDGARIRVLVTGAVLSLAPFRWTAFVQDLTEREEEPNEDETAVAAPFKEIVGRGAATRRVLRQVEVVAPTNATVLILGETGTGKELVARAIHHLSARREHPFISLNCAAIPTGLLESELFGYERGAFTGALARKIGRFELAHRGTLLLDEVGDIPLDLQPKLLRALEEKEFERLGGTRTIPIDVRLVAATNRNLLQMMGDKLFRSDLYYRLNVFPIQMPALRDHPEDIPLLVRHFVQKYAAEMRRSVQTIPSDVMNALVGYSWPGNVRELENFIERSVILSTGADLRAPLGELRTDAVEPENDNTLEQVDREHILRVLRETGGVVSRAAARLGLPRTTLNAMMRRLNISRKAF
jgi:PAS domain S-box-containing protein